MCTCRPTHELPCRGDVIAVEGIPSYRAGPPWELLGLLAGRGSRFMTRTRIDVPATICREPAVWVSVPSSFCMRTHPLQEMCNFRISKQISLQLSSCWKMKEKETLCLKRHISFKQDKWQEVISFVPTAIHGLWRASNIKTLLISDIRNLLLPPGTVCVESVCCCLLFIWVVDSWGFSLDHNVINNGECH